MKRAEQTPVKAARMLLGQHRWLSDASTLQIEALLCGARELRKTPGQYLFRADSQAMPMVILKGFVATGTANADGRSYLSNWLGSGEILNVVPVLDGGLAMLDCQAKTNVSVMILNGDAFRDMADKNLLVARNLRQFLCERIRRYQRYVNDTVFSSRLGRCARLLLFLAGDHGEVSEHGIRLRLSITQEELGEMLGCSRQSVNRELRYLEQDGLISIERANYVIHDPARLSKLAMSLEIDPT